MGQGDDMRAHEVGDNCVNPLGKNLFFEAISRQLQFRLELASAGDGAAPDRVPNML